MNTWFTSDLHLGHINISALAGRPFDSVDEMNENLIERWNYNVSDGDTVYILGDLCMGAIDESLPLIERLCGDKILVPGNHDRVFPGGRKNWRDWVPRYENVGLTVIEMIPPVLSVPITLGGIEAHMSHFPRKGDSGMVDRYSAYRPEWDSWLLHGHTHSREKINIKQKHVHVGVDAWRCEPVSEEQIVALIKGR